MQEGSICIRRHTSLNTVSKEHNMRTSTIAIVICLWFASNMVAPLVIRSVDRLYGKQLDAVLRRVISCLGILFNQFVRLAVLIYFAPLILLVRILIASRNQWLQAILGKMQWPHFLDLLFRKSFSVRLLIRFFKETPLARRDS